MDIRVEVLGYLSKVNMRMIPLGYFVILLGTIYMPLGA